MVMLYGPYPYDAKISLAGPIDADDVPALKAQGFDLFVNNRPDGESPRQMPTADLRAMITAAGIRFVDIPFKGAKLTAADVAAFAAAVRPARKVLASCATGTRCAMISAAAEVQAGVPLEVALGRAKKAGFDLAAMDSFIAGFAKAGAA